jgi:diguanylate cyclase (GGDEF)-like protein
MSTRRTIIGGAALLAYMGAYSIVCALLASDSPAVRIVADFGLIPLEAATLVLCWLAFRWNRGSADRWIWMVLGAWILGSLLGDAMWAYYEVLRSVEEVPTPGPADIGYLAGYLLSMGMLFRASWKTAGRLGAFEAWLDGAMLSIGVAGLGWPLLLSPMIEAYEPGLGFWVDLAYPVCDLLLIMVMASLFFGYFESERRRPPTYFVLICCAVALSIVADFSYFAIVNSGGEYMSGDWLDVLWTLSTAVAGVTALLGMRAGSEASAAQAAGAAPASARVAERITGASYWRTAIPYIALPVVAGMIALQALGEGWRWDRNTTILAYLGTSLVVLLVIRQYVTLVQNRRLNTSLFDTSRQLEEKVDDLADLNERLEVLNNQSHYLNSLRGLREVAAGGLELVCTFAKSPGGWISLRDEDDKESVAAIRGLADQYHPDDPAFNAAAIREGVLRALPLGMRDERLGTLWLVRPVGAEPGTDLLPVLATHIATALDNAKRYGEAVHLAEKDPLTGLYNHRGIHRRLAGEALRAQQSGSELSLIMLDLDDFKVLNDTYGHPAGDSVLKQVSDAIRAVLRHADLAGRVGGDELLLVLPNTGSEGALQLGERLRVALAARPYVTAGGHSIPVRLSLGVATFPQDAQSLGQLLEAVDSNLYASKQRGGNTTTGSPEDHEHETDNEGVLGVVGKLINVVGARDHYTRRHSEHVVLYALALGEAIGLPEDSLSTLHVAAMLHDVGKIGVPADLLRTPAPLNAAQEDMVRRHSVIGAEVINDIPRLAEVAQAVYAHHEHHDGGGYPAEASGDDIPLLGRILAVADAYAAMTLDKPYRKSMSRAEARTELLAVAGSQLDPELVERFVRLLDAQEQQTAGHALAGQGPDDATSNTAAG